MRQSPGLGKMESTMQKKTFFSYAIAIAGIVILSGAAVTPPLSQPYAGPRYEQRWIANDLSRPYDYRSSREARPFCFSIIPALFLHIIVNDRRSLFTARNECLRN
jgi:hypothetical protein